MTFAWRLISLKTILKTCFEINEDSICLSNSGFNQLKSQATNMAAKSVKSVLSKFPLTALLAHDHKSLKLIQQYNNASSRWGLNNITFTPLLKIQSIGWDDDRRGNPKKRSCGVSFVAVHSRDRAEWRTSGRTSCHRVTGRFLDFRHIVSAFQITPLYLST